MRLSPSTGLFPPALAARLALFRGTLLPLLLLLGIEVAGRQTRGDTEDGLALFALFLLFALVRRLHRRQPLPWFAAAVRGAVRARDALRDRFALVGIDLRGTPPLPGGFPPLLAGGVALLAGAAVLMALLPGADAVAAREAVRSLSAAAWLLLLGALWTLFLAGGFYLLFLTFALTHDALVRGHTRPGPRPRGVETLAFAGWTAALVAGWALLPPWFPVALLAASLAASVLALSLPGRPDVPLLWKVRGSREGVRSSSWSAHTLAGTALIGLLVADGLLFARGSALAGIGVERLESTLPVTSGFATLFGWTGAAALLAWSLLVVRTGLRARFRNPARETALPVRLRAGAPAGDLEAARRILAAGGFRVRVTEAAAPPLPAEVPVELVEGPVDPFRFPVPGEPVRVSLGDLASGEGQRRIRRRSAVLCRRLLFRGLEGLFKRAAGRRFVRGNGYWVAPWHWFCVGLSRDEDERTMDWKEGTFFLETIGPSYHRVFPLPVLAHARRVMGDLQVDLVFVEDGVGFRRLRRVLRRAFEVHDRSPEGSRAEDHHFSGLPGVRVVFHEFLLDEPWQGRGEGYPEPDYESIGRARILHVFRDRGESEETAEAPRDRRGAPVLV